MEEEVFSLRKKWAFTFFADAATLTIQSTQRNEGWHAKVKSLTSLHMPLSTFAAKQNEIVFQVDKNEQRDSVIRTIHAGLTSSALIPENVKKHLENINVSMLASNLFADVFTSAMRMRVASPQVLGSIEGRNLVLMFKTEHSLPNNDEERASKPIVCIKLTNLESRTWEADCPCCKQKRLCIPCRHLLAAILSCVRESGIDSASTWMRAMQEMKFLTNASNEQEMMISFVEKLLGRRWCHSASWAMSSQTSPTQGLEMSSTIDPARQHTSEDREWIQQRLGADPMVSILTNSEMQQSANHGHSEANPSSGHRQGNIVVGYQYPDFPIRASGEGTPEAYSQFMALAKIVAEELTRDACRLSVGHEMVRFLTIFIATVRETTALHGQDFSYYHPSRNGFLICS